ncbi:bifunctional heptose 7-phosphate kinase/heptose 1-phosphate adenyltransferase [Candidatus Oscillochloris fontis]|uniref:bifunctional heptose 7-phosphate kinase/heptose 1-phosphate adenyltransferase n=1 Tax=Candidatus Oscillochloris fontis TaxID=2496868 RepID=UPI00101C8F26|nr:bifunctional ADP-heptose synthase [Candidatus Oscillochloris fontis]
MPARLATLIPRLAGQRILVVGDVSLDEYLFGRATRLSREAPIPVLELQRREIILGGAANPARNVVALGSHASQISIVGDDLEGQQLRDLLRHAGIDDRGLVISPQRPTTRKTRILADESPRLPQQVARLDRLERGALAPDEEALVIRALHAQIRGANALICSDYQLGLMTPAVIQAARDCCQQHGVCFTVDAQGNSHAYHGANLFRCNNQEAAAALGRRLENEADFIAGLTDLRDELNAQLVIVTRGPHGLSIIGQDLVYQHLPAVQVSEVYDTIGAGDTFIAVATLGLAAGLAPLDAAQIANTAAALVVRRVGNAVVSPTELAQNL